MGAAATLDALAAAGEHTGWRVLDTARAQQFTGEIVFQTQPSISVYLDCGNAYYAVRTGDPSLCERLIEADVIGPAQIERGVIRVGNVENLGRLFDRDPSVDRDAVMVLLEIATDDVVTTVANAVTSSITLTAYRHHASGVHRWFVAPSDQRHHVPAQLAPVGEVAQIDASVTSDLPGLPGLTGLPDDFDDGVQIEWNQPLGRDLLDEPAPLHALDESILQSILDDSFDPVASNATLAAPTVPADEPTLGAADVAPPVPLAPPTLDALFAEPAPVVALDEPRDDSPVMFTADQVDISVTEESDVALEADDFQIVWPDGREHALIGPDADVAGTTPKHDTPIDTPLVDAPLHSSVIVPAEEVVRAAPEPAPEPLSFELPTLAVTHDNLPEDHQPEEVVDAVRRALEAIESALVAPARLPSVAVADLPSFEPATPLLFEVVEPLVVEPLVVEPLVVEPLVVEPRPSDAAEAAGQPEPASVAAPTAKAITAIEPFIEPVTEPRAATPAVSALESVLPPQTAAAADDVVVFAAAAAPTVVVQPVVEAAPAPLARFAPPTIEDSAEAVYARATEESAPVGSVSGVESVVFVDEDPGDRSGALRRLIGSLHRK